MMQRIKYQIIRALFKAYGIVLIFGFFILFHLVLYSFIYDTAILFYIEYEDKWISIVILIFGLIEGFNVIFNYCLTIFVSAGDTSQYFSNTEKIQESDQDNQQIESIIQTQKICHICQKPKPLRAHHCRICNVCILKMDHHCPWFGKCIGYQNQRYFLLLLTHLVIGTFYISLLNIFIIYNSNFSKYAHLQSKAFQAVWLLDIILFVILLAFCGWSWFLALYGYTTIEFLARKKNQIKLLNTKEQNLYIIFGKVEHWSEILLPSTRDLPSYAFISSNYFKQKYNQSFQNEDEQPLIDQEI